MRIEIMDTTLRDGEQTQGFSCSPLKTSVFNGKSVSDGI